MKKYQPTPIFPSVKCFFYGMYGDCAYLHEACHDENHVCIYADNPAAPYCVRRADMNDKLEPVGSTEGVWRYAHPSDVGLFLDGTYGWFLRHDDYLSWDIEKLRKWLAGKPANIYRPTKGGKAMLVTRPEYK